MKKINYFILIAVIFLAAMSLLLIMNRNNAKSADPALNTLPTKQGKVNNLNNPSTKSYVDTKYSFGFSYPQNLLLKASSTSNSPIRATLYNYDPSTILGSGYDPVHDKGIYKIEISKLLDENGNEITSREDLNNFINLLIPITCTDNGHDTHTTIENSEVQIDEEFHRIISFSCGDDPYLYVSGYVLSDKGGFDINLYLDTRSGLDTFSQIISSFDIQ
jgi:hypothetical protein